jgi:hypothetical protein
LGENKAKSHKAKYKTGKQENRKTGTNANPNAEVRMQI